MLQLALAGHIAGTLTDPVGSPLSDIEVEVILWDPDWGYGRSIRSTFTDPDGTYIIGGLGTGIYRVCFHDSNSAYAPECYDDVAGVDSGTDVAVTAGETTAASMLNCRCLGASPAPWTRTVTLYLILRLKAALGIRIGVTGNGQVTRLPTPTVPTGSMCCAPELIGSASTTGITVSMPRSATTMRRTWTAARTWPAPSGRPPPVSMLNWHSPGTLAAW